MVVVERWWEEGTSRSQREREGKWEQREAKANPLIKATTGWNQCQILIPNHELIKEGLVSA